MVIGIACHQNKMPKLREIDIDYDQIRELVCQPTFSKKMSLIRKIVKDKRYIELLLIPISTYHQS